MRRQRKQRKQRERHRGQDFRLVEQESSSIQSVTSCHHHHQHKILKPICNTISFILTLGEKTNLFHLF